MVTAVKAGTATITATAGGETATCTVTVKESAPEEQGLKLDKTELALEVGETGTLAAIGVSEEETVTWKSDDDKVATVENGVVTAVAEGTAIITAEAGGKTSTCTVTVTKSGSEQQ